MKRLIADLHADNPRVKGSMLAALGNVKPSHLMDVDLWDRFDVPVFREVVERHKHPERFDRVAPRSNVPDVSVADVANTSLPTSRPAAGEATT